ncbi:MAG TPA: oligopeptidase A, partial [Rhodanobacteraceae bacterium]|nr:oligopeptidase A [Rhodanobacteraceae bacterium]
MNSANPLLSESPLPTFSAIEPAHVLPAVDAVLADYRAAVDAIIADPAPRSFARVLQRQEELEDRLELTWSPVSHLHAVADSEALRAVYSQALEKITEHASELGQNRELYAAVRAVADAGQFAALPRAARTLVEHALRDFRLSGVALEEPARSRFREITNTLARLENEFENAVLDATEAWSESISDEAALAGLGQTDRDLLRDYAKDAGRDGWLVTLKQPSVQAV